MKNVKSLYDELHEEFGDPKLFWPQWCSDVKNVSDREFILIGVILCQRTSWHNVNIALTNLRRANLLSIDLIAKDTDIDVLTSLIRLVGFFTTKPRTLLEVCRFVVNNGGISCLMEQEETVVWDKLIAIKGIGKESADTIMLYALDKPRFVIDEYTYRFSELHGFKLPQDYDTQQKFYMDNLPKDVQIYQKFHALIIISQIGILKSTMRII